MKCLPFLPLLLLALTTPIAPFSAPTPSSPPAGKFLTWARSSNVVRIPIDLVDFPRNDAKAVRGVAIRTDCATALSSSPPSIVFATPGILSDSVTTSRALPWDTKLTLALWTEIRQGDKSPFSAYINLLRSSSDAIPPPTIVPDSPRNSSEVMEITS